MNIIQIRNVNKKYKTGVNAINDLSLDIEKGEFVFVIGSTGCGKSTLIKMLYREEKPTSGKIMLGGIDVARLRNNKVYKLRKHSRRDLTLESRRRRGRHGDRRKWKTRPAQNPPCRDKGGRSRPGRGACRLPSLDRAA